MSSTPTSNHVELIAHELDLPLSGVGNVIRLAKEKNTVPFIARYRKEMTSGLDEVQIRDVLSNLELLENLDARRKAIVSQLEKRGILSPSLERRLTACRTRAELEDFYLPYRKKRLTRAQKARERGLEPLADLLADMSSRSRPEDAAQRFLNDKVPDIQTALAGARDIVAERTAENARVRAVTRQTFSVHGRLCARKHPKYKEGRSKYEQYYQFSERLCRVPSHRYLAVARGEREVSDALLQRVYDELRDLAAAHMAH